RKPDDDEALSVLEQIFTQAQAYPELLAIYRRREAAATAVAPHLELLLKIAWIEEAQLAELDAAITTYRKILALAGGDELKDEAAVTRSLRALEKIFSGRGDWAGLVGVLERQLALLGDDVDAKVAMSH